MNEVDAEVTRHWGDLQNAVPEKEAAVRVDEPTDAGWYAYSGGAQTMVFHLRTEPRRQWTAHFGGGGCGDCEWGYIEQALGVWDLVPLRPARWERMGIESVVFEALGAASKCWTPPPTGVFDSERASVVGGQLVEFINRLLNDKRARVMAAAAAIADDAVPEKEAQSRAARAAAIAREEALVEVTYGLGLIARAVRAMGWDQADGVELAAQWVKAMNGAEQ